MTQSINFASPDLTGNVESSSSSSSIARWKRDTDASTTSGTNAFATSLASAMNTRMSPPTVAKKHGADSELDDHPKNVNAHEAGAGHGTASYAVKAATVAAVNGLSASAPGVSPTAAPPAAAAATAAAPTGTSANSSQADGVSNADGSSGSDDSVGTDSDIPSGSTGIYDGNAAFAAAAGARAAAANTPVDSTISNTDALNPEFRAKLGRVVTRMHDEFGKDVQIVEGYRTQSRQDFLYDQGRTRPGDVVTWTKSSKHTLGLAADVTINGSYADAAGYQQLAQVAAQEGLKTLGAKDPGHIEMPTRSGAAAWGAPAESLNIDSNVSRAIGIAMDQNAVSDDSGDNTDALNTFNGLLSRVGRGSLSGLPQGQAPAVSGAGGGMSGGLGGGMSQRGSGDARKDTSKDSDAASVASVADVASVAQIAQVAQVAQVAQGGHIAAAGTPQLAVPGVSVPAPASAIRSDSAERVGNILDTRDAAPVQPLSQVTLNMDNATGSADKITVQLRGGAVDTAISVDDPNRADKMSRRVGELQHALEQRGIATTTISVASTSADSGPGWSPRQGSDQSAQNGRSSLNHRDSRQDADATRQRARKEQQGGRQK